MLCHIPINKNVLSASLNKTFPSQMWIYLAARVLLYAPSNKQDDTFFDFGYRVEHLLEWKHLHRSTTRDRSDNPSVARSWDTISHLNVAGYGQIVMFHFIAIPIGTIVEWWARKQASILNGIRAWGVESTVSTWPNPHSRIGSSETGFRQ